MRRKALLICVLLIALILGLAYAQHYRSTNMDYLLTKGCLPFVEEGVNFYRNNEGTLNRIVAQARELDPDTAINYMLNQDSLHSPIPSELEAALENLVADSGSTYFISISSYGVSVTIAEKQNLRVELCYWLEETSLLPYSRFEVQDGWDVYCFYLYR